MCILSIFPLCIRNFSSISTSLCKTNENSRASTKPGVGEGGWNYSFGIESGCTVEYLCCDSFLSGNLFAARSLTYRTKLMIAIQTAIKTAMIRSKEPLDELYVLVKEVSTLKRKGIIWFWQQRKVYFRSYK